MDITKRGVSGSKEGEFADISNVLESFFQIFTMVDMYVFFRIFSNFQND
jgi:hypothetical protein